MLAEYSSVWLYYVLLKGLMDIPSGLVGKESAYNVEDLGSIPGLGRSPVGGHGNPLQYPCLENPHEEKSWGATVYGVSGSQTWLSDFHLRVLYRESF